MTDLLAGYALIAVLLFIAQCVVRAKILCRAPINRRITGGAWMEYRDASWNHFTRGELIVLLFVCPFGFLAGDEKGLRQEDYRLPGDLLKSMTWPLSHTLPLFALIGQQVTTKGRLVRAFKACSTPSRDEMRMRHELRELLRGLWEYTSIDHARREAIKDIVRFLLDPTSETKAYLAFRENAHDLHRIANIIAGDPKKFTPAVWQAFLTCLRDVITERVPESAPVLQEIWRSHATFANSPSSLR